MTKNSNIGVCIGVVFVRGTKERDHQSTMFSTAFFVALAVKNNVNFLGRVPTEKNLSENEKILIEKRSIGTAKEG